MALDISLRRTINLALLALALLATLASLLQTWWTVEGQGGGFGYRIFEARPYRSEAGQYLEPLDGALDEPVAVAGWLLVLALLLLVAAAAVHDVSRRWVRLPGWLGRYVALGAAALIAAAAIVAATTWPGAWSQHVNERTAAFDFRIERAEWDGRWAPEEAEGGALVYESRAGWFFAWGAMALAVVAAAFDYVAARPWFPAGVPPPVMGPPEPPAAPPSTAAPPPPPPKPEFTRRY